MEFEVSNLVGVLIVVHSYSVLCFGIGRSERGTQEGRLKRGWFLTSVALGTRKPECLPTGGIHATISKC